MNQLYWNNAKGNLKKKSGKECKDYNFEVTHNADDKQEEQKASEEEEVFDDGTGPRKMTHKAILRPAPYP